MYVFPAYSHFLTQRTSLKDNEIIVAADQSNWTKIQAHTDPSALLVWFQTDTISLINRTRFTTSFSYFLLQSDWSVVHTQHVLVQWLASMRDPVVSTSTAQHITSHTSAHTSPLTIIDAISNSASLRLQRMHAFCSICDSSCLIMFVPTCVSLFSCMNVFLSV